MNSTLAALPPQKRISECIQNIYMLHETAKIASRVSWRNSAPELATAIIASIEEDPKVSKEEYTVDMSTSRAFRNKISKPLMHWVCSLDLPLSVLEAIHRAFPEAVRTAHVRSNALSEESAGVLPLHEAIRSNAQPQIVEYLVQEYPEAIGIKPPHGGLPLHTALFSSPYSKELYPLLSEGLTQSQIKEATSSGWAPWDGAFGPFPLATIQSVIDIHGPRSLTVVGKIGMSGALITLKADTLVIEIEANMGFTYAIEQLLLLPIPLKSLGTQTLDDPNAVVALIATIRKEQEEEEEEEEDFRALGLPPVPKLPPLDVSNVENVSVDSVLQSPKTVMDLLTSLENLPNLKSVACSCAQNQFEGLNDNLFTAECFQGLAALSSKLENISLIYFYPIVVLPLAELIKNSNILKSVSLTSYHLLSSDQISIIIEALTINKSIESLTLGQLQSSSLLEVMRDIQLCPNVKELKLEGVMWGIYSDKLYTAECLEGLDTLSTQLERISLKYFDPVAVIPLAYLMKKSTILKSVSFTCHNVLNSNHISIIAKALRINTSIESLALGQLESGTGSLLEVIRDIQLCPNLKVFSAEGGDKEGHIEDIKHFVLLRSLTPLLRGTDVSGEDAFRVYEQYLEDTSILYSLLRYRPELWCAK